MIYTSSEYMHVGDGTSINIHLIGSSSFYSSFNSKILSFKQLLHVLSITKNLLSVSKFAVDDKLFLSSILIIVCWNEVTSYGRETKWSAICFWGTSVSVESFIKHPNRFSTDWFIYHSKSSNFAFLSTRTCSIWFFFSITLSKLVKHLHSVA